MTTLDGSVRFDSLGGATPATLAPFRRVVQFDGRLHNRQDLLLRLGSEGVAKAVRLGRASSVWNDAEVVGALLERSGAAALGSMLGDWSLVFWDPDARTLNFARDYMGARPLFVFADEHVVSWSGDLGQLVERCGRRDALSDLFAAGYMSSKALPAMTPYEQVLVVPPGTCLTVQPSGDIHSRQLWTLNVGDIRHPDRRWYEEELRRLWHESLRVRLVETETIWAEISGGLDSSSVVCMADRLIKMGAVPTGAMRLVSHATLHSPEGDERRFIAEVEREVGVASEIVGVEDNQTASDSEIDWITPYALHGVGLEMVRRVRAAGGRLVLSGRLGDAVMGCQPDNSEAVFDDLRHGHLLASIRKLRAWSRATRKPILELVWRLFTPVGEGREDVADLLTPRLRTVLDDLPDLVDVSTLPREKRAVARMVAGYSRGGRLEIPYRPADVRYTYPFSHRPLVEFMLAIPGEELSAPGMPRALMRRAFATLLPARILNRRSKGYYPPAAFRAARRQAAALVDAGDLEVVERGWIDPERLRSSLQSFVAGGGENGVPIARVLRLERWLQARHLHRSIPQRKEVKRDAVLNA